jgi:hypothetical protein
MRTPNHAQRCWWRRVVPDCVRLLTVTCMLFGLPGIARAAQAALHVSFPLTASSAGSDPMGIDVGVTFEDETKQEHVVVGLDAIYHYWPASSEYKAAFDEHLTHTRSEVIDGSTWAFYAYQFGGHVKVVLPLGERLGPWAQIGGAIYTVDRNISPNEFDLLPGWNGSFGFDVPTVGNAAISVCATYHRLIEQERNGIPDFEVWTIGTQIRIGW